MVYGEALLTISLRLVSHYIETDGITKHGTIEHYMLRNFDQPLLIYGNPVQQSSRPRMDNRV